MCLCGRWPRLVGGLWREDDYTVPGLMHSECGRIYQGAVGKGGLIRRGLLYRVRMPMEQGLIRPKCIGLQSERNLEHTTLNTLVCKPGPFRQISAFT